MTDEDPNHGYPTYGAWLKSKGIQVDPAAQGTASGLDRTVQKRWDSRLDSYFKERKNGNLPGGTKPAQIEHAKRVSDLTGNSYNASQPLAGFTSIEG